MINKIILGHALNVLPQLPAESVSCVTCSPPYWGLRDYGIEPVIWDGDKDCKHIFSMNTKCGDIRFRGENSIVGSERNPKVWEGDGKGQFCQFCGAWKGSLGLEPAFELYIKHLCDIFDEIKRVLRKDGTCFVNIGDTYAGGGGWTGVPDDWESLSTDSRQKRFDHNKKNISIPAKSLCDIPYRFSIEMTNRGWIKRNTIIWHKLNCMPSSADDRFTVDFEYLFFFTKNNKAIFWTNEKTLECVDKNPPGTKGIEGKDWEWRKCPNCQGEGTIVGKALKEGAAPIIIGNGIVTKNTKTFKTCPRCKGSGKVKYSFWTGHDYWFEQQFEEHTTKDDLDRRKNKFWSENIADGGSGKQNKGRDRREFYGKQGRNKRCVWTIPTQPFPEAHFAVYPEDLIEIPIKAGCPEFICKKCGKARVKIYENHRQETRPGNYSKYTDDCYVNSKRPEGLKKRIINNPIEVGYSDCGCNEGWESGVVLDPFIGSGTTAREALKQRKRFIGIDIKQEYVDMSYRKIAKVQQRIF